MKTGISIIFLLIFSLSFTTCDLRQESHSVQGWTIFSDNYTNALKE